MGLGMFVDDAVVLVMKNMPHQTPKDQVPPKTAPEGVKNIIDKDKLRVKVATELSRRLTIQPP